MAPAEDEGEQGSVRGAALRTQVAAVSTAAHSQGSNYVIEVCFGLWNGAAAAEWGSQIRSTFHEEYFFFLFVIGAAEAKGRRQKTIKKSYQSE